MSTTIQISTNKLVPLETLGITCPGRPLTKMTISLTYLALAVVTLLRINLLMLVVSPELRHLPSCVDS